MSNFQPPIAESKSQKCHHFRLGWLKNIRYGNWLAYTVRKVVARFAKNVIQQNDQQQETYAEEIVFGGPINEL